MTLNVNISVYLNPYCFSAGKKKVNMMELQYMRFFSGTAWSLTVQYMFVYVHLHIHVHELLIITFSGRFSNKYGNELIVTFL
jgi:hypothetical protein